MIINILSIVLTVIAVISKWSAEHLGKHMHTNSWNGNLHWSGTFASICVMSSHLLRKAVNKQLRHSVEDKNCNYWWCSTTTHI